MTAGPNSQRALILAPNGRDSEVAIKLLAEAGLPAFGCPDLSALVREIELGAGLAIIAEEALRYADLRRLADWVARQPAWSDFSFIVLTYRATFDTHPLTGRLSRLLGNVSYVERPFHPTSLISLIGSAMRARGRQYEARARLEELRQEKERLRFAQEAGRIGTFELMPNTGRLEVSETFCRIWGLPVEPSVALSQLMALVIPEDRGGIRTDEPEPGPGALDYIEYRIHRPDTGEMKWIARQGELVSVGDGMRRYFGVVYDITERKRDEDLLREFNETLEHQVQVRTRERDRAWKNSRDLQVVVEPSGVLRAANDAWATILGWRAQEVVGQPQAAFTHPDDIAASQKALAIALSAGHAAYENRMLHKDGTCRWISWVAALDDGLVYASGRHVTLEKEAAAELAFAQEALRQAQKMEAVGQLTGGIAHDFNNLLGGISGGLEIMHMRLKQGRHEDLERYLLVAQGAATRAAALTHRLLAFSRRQTLDPKPTDANRLIRGMSDLIQRSVGPGVTLDVVEAAGLWPTLVDPPQLESALLNLCINARDAMPQGGRLTIATANQWLDEQAARPHELAPGPYVVIRVSDTGSGMDPQTISRAFDPFFTTKPLGQGTGLGLSMVYGFARQSGGQVRIQSEIGKGATLSLYLPRRHGPLEDVEPKSTVGATGAGAGETILVIDDEPSVRSLMVEVLSEAGYGVLEAEDGAAGLGVLDAARRIDLLITDVGLPGGLNGRQVADSARVARPDLKVLFITGFAETAAIGDGRLGMGMEVLTKPFAMAELSQRVTEMIARQPA